VGQNPIVLHVTANALKTFTQELHPVIDKGLVFRREYLRRRKDGSTFLTDNTVTGLFDESGKRTGAVVVIRDITERKRLEEEISKSQKLESLGILAGGIAHDFNNILATILGNISLAKIMASPQDEL